MLAISGQVGMLMQISHFVRCQSRVEFACDGRVNWNLKHPSGRGLRWGRPRLLPLEWKWNHDPHPHNLFMQTPRHVVHKWSFENNELSWFLDESVIMKMASYCSIVKCLVSAWMTISQYVSSKSSMSLENVTVTTCWCTMMHKDKSIMVSRTR